VVENQAGAESASEDIDHAVILMADYHGVAGLYIKSVKMIF